MYFIASQQRRNNNNTSTYANGIGIKTKGEDLTRKLLKSVYPYREINDCAEREREKEKDILRDMGKRKIYWIKRFYRNAQNDRYINIYQGKRKRAQQKEMRQIKN